MGGRPRPHSQSRVTLQVSLSAEADADIATIYNWYENAQTGLGHKFIESVDGALEQIAQFPESGRLVRGEIRRILTRRFPYGLLYIVGDGEVVVLGCFHLRRDPSVWSSRG